jgi:hypothetical protein
MAEEILVKEALTREKIAAGKQLTEILDKTDLPIAATFWYYFAENQEWEFVVGVSVAPDEGLLKSIAKINKIVKDVNIEGIDWLSVRTIRGDDRIIRSLRKLVLNGKNVEGTRIKNGISEGMLIYDVYIYRLSKPTRRKKAA